MEITTGTHVGGDESSTVSCTMSNWSRSIKASAL